MNFNFNFKDKLLAAWASTRQAVKGKNLGFCRDWAHCCGGRRNLQPLEKLLRRHELRKKPFFHLKRSRMHASSAAPKFDGMLEVQHLVIDDVLHRVAGNRGVVEHPADHDGIVRGVVMPKYAASAAPTPAHARTRQQSVKKPRVQVFEYHLKIIKMSFRTVEALAAAYLPHQVRLADDFTAADIFAITSRLAAIDGLPVDLREQNVSDGAKNGFGSAFEQVREPHQKPTLAHADGVIDVCEGKEFNLHLGRGRSRPQRPVRFVKKFRQAVSHAEGRLARRHFALRTQLFLLLFGSFFQVGQQLAVLIRGTVESIDRVAENELIGLDLFRRDVRGILQRS